MVYGLIPSKKIFGEQSFGILSSISDTYIILSIVTILKNALAPQDNYFHVISPEGNLTFIYTS